MIWHGMAMIETFPIQCAGCHEIFDALMADVENADPHRCLLCGFSIVISSSTDFQLPQLAEVIIEEHSHERLRLRMRMRRYLHGSENHFMGWVLIGLGAIFLGLGVCVCMYGLDHRDFFELLSGVPAVAGGLIAIVLGFYYTRASFSLELLPDRVSVGYHLGPLRFHRNYPRPVVSGVFMASSAQGFWADSADCVACLQAGSGTIRCADSRNPEAARYVTHLIRRQLITMGHKLQDG